MVTPIETRGTRGALVRFIGPCNKYGFGGLFAQRRGAPGRPSGGPPWEFPSMPEVCLGFEAMDTTNPLTFTWLGDFLPQIV